MTVGPIERMRSMPALTLTSSAMYAASLLFLLIGLITWVPERNPVWVFVVGLSAAVGALVWAVMRGQNFTPREAQYFMVVQLATIGAMTWNTEQPMGAFTNGTTLPVIGIFAVWFLPQPKSRLIFYAGVLFWLAAILRQDERSLFGYSLILAAQTIIATEVFRQIKLRMDRLVRTDPLTDVLNLRGVSEALNREMARASRRGSLLTVVAIDLDGLRALNNTRGHRAGDELLRAVTEHWRSEVRPFDLIGRTGGDEFIIVLPDTSLGEASRVVERLAASSPGEWSAGLAQLKAEDTVASLLERADQRMYVEKASRYADEPIEVE